MDKNWNWIVGVDGSPDGASALTWAVQAATRTAGTVTPLTAWHATVPLSLTGRHQVLPEAGRQAVEAGAAKLMEATVGAAQAPDGVIGTPRIIEGYAVPALLDATGPDAQLVVGRRGISDLKHRLLGSVSQYLATHAHGPVIVVPAAWNRAECRRIVVGFDGSDHAAAALRWALDFAGTDADDSVTVTALIAIDLVPWMRPEHVEERHPEELAAAKERLLAAADAVDPDGRAERKVVLHGARQALAEEAGDADLLVVGPRGMGGVGRALLGSVTTWLLHDTACPVAVIPSA